MASPSTAPTNGKAFYGYLFTKAKPIPAPTPVFDALLRAIALHIVRQNPAIQQIYLLPRRYADCFSRQTKSVTRRTST
jgi:hypothetical protein